MKDTSSARYSEEKIRSDYRNEGKMMKMKTSHHVTEFLNPTRKKSPDPMTKAAFFTESQSPPVFSCSER